MRVAALIAATLLAPLASAHTVLSYPGWRGDNLVTNETFRYGMQWMYPCGGLLTTTNRTKWPIGGGAVNIQPGWNSGHPTAFFYINMGFGTDPANYSYPMVPVFQIVGPSRNPYPGSFCLPQVPLPVNQTVKVGDNATIQVIEVAIHGASLYNCVDITFAEPEDVEPVTHENCINTTDHITFSTVFTSVALTADSSLISSSLSLSTIPLLLASMWALL